VWLCVRVFEPDEALSRLSSNHIKHLRKVGRKRPPKEYASYDPHKQVTANHNPLYYYAIISVTKECSWTKRRMCTHHCCKGMLLDKKTDVHSSVLQRNALGQKDGCALISVTKECSWTNRRMCTHQCYKRMLLDKKTDVHLHVSTRICTHIHQRFEA
jgi:hypothetical protein